MKKQKVYLETTLFNYYFDSERDAHLATVQLFNEIKQGKWDVFTSDYVVAELLNANDDKKEKMLSLINEYSMTVLKECDEIAEIADDYRNNKILPFSSVLDSMHLACATYYDMDLIISLNFRHIVRAKTIEKLHLYNAIRGFSKPQIHAPMEVIDYETDI